MSAESKLSHNVQTLSSERKTSFRLRQLKNAFINRKPGHPISPPRHSDYYSYQKTKIAEIKPIQTKMRKTSFNFSQRATLKSSPMEESKLVAMRRTFYGTGSRDNQIQSPSSSSRAIFGRSSLSFHQQNIFKDQSNSNYLNKYTIVKELGKGSFSTVYLAYKRIMSPTHTTIQSQNLPLQHEKTLKPKQIAEKQISGEENKNEDLKQWVAIKVYQKFKMGKQAYKLKNIKKEITLMQNMDNQGVAKLYQSAQTLTKISLVVQYGGEQSLLDYVKRNHPLPMQTVASIALQLIKAIAYLHSRNIVHRDIKLQNVLIQKEKIKLIDFGFSCLTHKQQKLTTICGTPNYMAPEVISRKDYVGEQADVWSFGVLVFALAQGRHPFKAETYNQLQRLVNRGSYELKRAKDQAFANFLRRILKVKGAERLSAKEISEMEWINQQ